MARRRTRTLEEAIGAELKRRREGAGLRQEDVARQAQTFGLEWGQAIVSAIEAGRRSLSLGELLLLPRILQDARSLHVAPHAAPPHRLRVRDMIPDSEEPVSLSATAPARTVVPARVVRGLLEDYDAAIQDVPRGFVSRGITEADRKAARALGTSPERVVEAAVELWGRQLDEERDRQIGDPTASAQKRGRITRKLTEQLRQRMKRRRKT